MRTSLDVIGNVSVPEQRPPQRRHLVEQFCLWLHRRRPPAIDLVIQTGDRNPIVLFVRPLIRTVRGGFSEEQDGSGRTFVCGPNRRILIHDLVRRRVNGLMAARDEERSTLSFLNRIQFPHDPHMGTECLSGKRNIKMHITR